MSVHNSIRETEGSFLNRLDSLVGERKLSEEAPRQTTGHLPELMRNAFVVKRDHYDPFFQTMEKEDLKEGRRRLKFSGSKLKGIWRCIEKIELRQVPLKSCENICDIVRGAIGSNSVDVLADVYQRLLDAQSSTRSEFCV
jgi:hypothetical protein